MKNKRLHFWGFIVLFSLFIFSFFNINVVNAATLNFSPSSGNFTVGNIFTVNILVNTQGVSVNNAEAVFNFPKDFLEIVSISRSGSIFSLWVEEPVFSNSSGTLSFNGGVPTPGFTGSSGKALSVVFRVKKVGSASVIFSSASIRANDGLGTDVLTSKNQANFNLSKAVEKVPTPKPTPTLTPSQINPSITIEELKKINEFDFSTKFLLTSVGKKEKSLYKIEIDGLEYPWNNQESGIFETPELSKGRHTIKVSVDTSEDEIISASASFTITSLLVPVFTDYSKDVKENEYIVVKGLADPNTDIIINSNRILPDGGDAINDQIVIKSNDKGLFTYVSENRAVAGVYIISAQARTNSGVLSEKTLPVKISVSTKTISVSTNIMKILSTLIPLIGLLILLILLLIWGWYRISNYRENTRRRLINTKALVSKSFGILGEDVAEEIKIFKKIKARESLSGEERLFINQFKKDIELAEKAIVDGIREVEK